MEPLPAPKESLDRAQRILTVAAILLVVLFVYEARGTFAGLILRRPVTAGACVRGADGRGYYAWLRSPLLDGDVDFENEYAALFAEAPGSEVAFPPTATGLRSNHWPIGPALAWAPAVVTVHGILSSLGRYAPWPADGYSAPYQLAVGGTTLALALLTLVLAYRIGRRFAGPTAAAAAASLITLGTPVVAYGTVEVSMAHGPAAATLTLFVFVWLRTFGSTRLRRWVVLGCLLGLAALMRPQLATFALLPALEALWLTLRAERWSLRLGIAVRLASAGLASAVVFIPQLVAKQVLYGHPLGGMYETGHNWLNPSLWTALGSNDRSLFYWTPIALPAFLGLVYGACRTRGPALVFLAAAAVAQVWTMAALLGGVVCLGSSFGFRFLTETCVLFTPGLALLLDWVSERTARRLLVGGGVLVGWNLFLLGVYRHSLGVIQGGDVAAVLTAALRFIEKRPLEAIGMLAAATWLTKTLIAAFHTDREPVAGAAPDQVRPRLAG